MSGIGHCFTELMPLHQEYFYLVNCVAVFDIRSQFVQFPLRLREFFVKRLLLLVIVRR